MSSPNTELIDSYTLEELNRSEKKTLGPTPQPLPWDESIISRNSWKNSLHQNAFRFSSKVITLRLHSGSGIPSCCRVSRSTASTNHALSIRYNPLIVGDIPEEELQPALEASSNPIPTLSDPLLEGHNTSVLQSTQCRRLRQIVNSAFGVICGLAKLSQ